MKRSASAVWTGGIKDGKGTLSTESGVLKESQYSFAGRFENGSGTNPEELIGAAHAGCFSMAFSGHLQGAGMSPESIRTTAHVSVEKVEGGFAISGIHLDVTARVPGADERKFQEIAEKAKAGCPVSKALASIKITMTAKLEA